MATSFFLVAFLCCVFCHILSTLIQSENHLNSDTSHLIDSKNSEKHKDRNTRVIQQNLLYIKS